MAEPNRRSFYEQFQPHKKKQWRMLQAKVIHLNEELKQKRLE